MFAFDYAHKDLATALPIAGLDRIRLQLSGNSADNAAVFARMP